MPKQTLAVLPQQFTIHSLSAEASIPPQVTSAPLYFIGKTEEALSIVLPEDIELHAEDYDPHWRALELIGPLDLSMVGIMAQIGAVLAAAKVSIFVLSTFDTDFFLVKDNKLADAMQALSKADYKIIQA